MLNGEDRWSILLDDDRKFIVGALRRRFDQQWNKEISIKVICFIWKAVQKRILTVKALQEKGVLIKSLGCGSFISCFDCVDHIIVHCPFTCEIRREIFKWCGIYQSMFNNLEDIISFINTWGNGSKKNNRFIAISYGMIWNLLKYRNDMLFKSIFTSPSKGVDFIKSSVYLWIKRRGRGEICKWGDWVSSPFHTC
uniref:Reverse transcriptase zinc-binding domain-containing protein n=1 Tax=Lactuca sativa TaxID=4236 RepID=A0A9R1VY74_LACSA|nr:hypothetical protein LSAT_V11C400178600 [Lactuca sativa]